MKILILSAFLVIFYLNLISTAPDHNIKKRYIFFPTATSNLTGWTQTVVTLAQFLFGPNPYILG
ncbi:unnamed protein product [Nezara viridula]|uniref:Neuropeptide n=1 Tax=Nezara viridula TaxID=85310 RepID=A0A9P0MQY1_NEZVI|nr:unnamed protein product [Nezara viridula]